MRNNSIKLNKPYSDDEWKSSGDAKEAEFAVDQPAIHYRYAFTSDEDRKAEEKPLTADALVQGVLAISTMLVQYCSIEPSFKHAHRLELEATTSRIEEASGRVRRWRLTMRIPAIGWFCTLVDRTPDDRRAAIESARHFVDDVHGEARETALRNALVGVDSETATATNPTPPTPSNLCHGGFECDKSNKCTHYHPLELCPQLVKRRTTTAERCEWVPTACARVWQSQDWLLLAKKEAVRDVLLFPRPPKHHMSNRELVQKKSSWQQVLETLTFIDSAIGPCAVDRIAVNFGEWETERSLNPNSLSCHGHVHFLLTIDAVNDCAGEAGKTAGFANMVGRLGEPVNYRLLDANELQQQVLLAEEIKLQNADMQRLSDMMAKISSQQVI